MPIYRYEIFKRMILATRYLKLNCNGTYFYFRCHVQDRKLAALSSLVRAPFSVLFDAVRCEDWLGQDSFLPFTKVKKTYEEAY